MFANAFLFLVLFSLIAALFPTPNQSPRWRWWHTLAAMFLLLGVGFLVAGIYLFLLRYAI